MVSVTFDLQYLLFLQDARIALGGVLDEVFNGISKFAVVIMPLLPYLIYWAVDKKWGYRFLATLWCGEVVNGIVKLSVCAYRPWIRSDAIEPAGDSKVAATGYSFPSGHTMCATATYGTVFAWQRKKRKWLAVLCAVMILLTMFSRNFLGVHTPQDVLVGFLAGCLVMWLTVRLMRWVEAHPEKDWLVVCIGLGLAAAVAVYAAVKPYPADYDAEGKLIVDGAKMANDTFKGVGWSAAFLIGWILERRFVGFATDIPLTRKLLRAAGGLLGYYAFSLILVPLVKSWIPGPAGTIVSCFIQMFFVSFLFPWCFHRLEKVGAQPEAAPARAAN